MIVPVPQFTQPAYTDRTLNPVQRMVNLYPEPVPGGFRMVSYPGFKSIGAAGNGASCAGSYFSSSGKMFTVHGNTIYEIASGGAATSRGTIGVSAAFAYWADDGTTLFIVIPGDDGYTLTMSAGSVTVIADSNFPSNAHGAAFIDGYFVTCKITTGQFYLSQLNDATDWTPVQFATAEYAGDVLYACKRLANQLYLFGARSIETWYNTGNPDFPFERVNGGTLDIGLGAAYSLDSINETAYFVGSSQAGVNAIYELSRAGIKKISTPYIESLITGTYVSSWVGNCFHVDGHSWYEISNYTSGGSIVYCIDTGLWIERVPVGTASNFRFIVNGFSSAGQPPYGFSFASDAIYEVRPDYNSNAGTGISRIRVFGPISSNSKRVFHKQIRIELEAKFDATGTTSIAPTLEWSDDGGLTYSTAVTMTTTITNTTTSQRIRLVANRLGWSSERYYRLTGPSNSCKLIYRNCELDLEEGRF